MAYKNFQVTKELYLPIELGDSLTLSEYKEKYGIDLSKYLELGEDYTIKFRFPELTKVFIACLNFGFADLPLVAQPLKVSESEWEEGSQDAITALEINDIDSSIGGGIGVRISQDDPFDWDHVIIGSIEI